MALINVLDIRFLNNPAPISSPYEIEIQFECLDSLAHDLEWKLIYVGSGFPSDVELDSLLVGPIPTGVNKFVFSADPIDVSQIPNADVLGVSVILLTASYDDREFVRVGFYNNNEYADPGARARYDALLVEGSDEDRAAWKFEGVRQVPVQRNILTAKPRVTRFNIKWDNENFNDAPPEQEEPADDGEEGTDLVALEDLGRGEDGEEEDDEQEEEEEEEEGEGEESATGNEQTTSAPMTGTTTTAAAAAAAAVAGLDTAMTGNDGEEDLSASGSDEIEVEGEESDEDDDDEEEDDDDEEEAEEAEEEEEDGDAKKIKVDASSLQKQPHETPAAIS